MIYNPMNSRVALRSRNAFTLIELLVVIAIIAILAVVVVLTLNPAELLRQSRDSNRLSDLATLTSALNLYNTDQGGASGYSLGSANVTYLSIPDPSATTTAGSDCSGLGFPSGGSFHCAASSTFRSVNSTGWIPVNLQTLSSGAPLGSLPIDPVNTTSSNFYYTYQTDGTSFKIRAVPESNKYLAQAGTNPNLFTVGSKLALGGGTGWVLVPGNSTFGTNNFYVMKYDAACVSISTGAAQTTPTDGNGYQDTGNNCTSAHGLAPAALPNAIPIVDVAETSAKQYCSSIGAHLLTNDEYMTIAMNAAGQGSNWTGGSVGSGGLYIGNANNASEYPADPNDANGYSNGTGGTMANQTITYTGDERRTLTLSDGSTIWDMSGNIWQEVQRSVNNVGDLTTTMIVPSCTGGGGWNWCQFPNISAWSTDVTQARIAPPNSAWSSSQDIGQVYTYGSGGNQGTNAFIRGDHWYAGSADGAFALFLSWGTGHTTGNVGFRCAR
jgi:prepilin-type N-terminal cleavage/methylation domain-containing protein